MSRCFPHIINICCQHIVAEFTDVDLVDSSEVYDGMDPHGNPGSQTFEEAVKRDPIALGRAVVHAIRASGQQREDFTTLIQEGNRKKHFSIGDRSEIIVPHLQLLRDVKTRWDSIYYMIRRLRIMRPVCDCILFIMFNISLILLSRPLTTS